MAKDDDLLVEAREQFERCADAEAENRKEALDDIRFSRLSEQWPDEIKRQREIEGRPCLTINRLPSFIRQVVNDARQNKPSIKVRPVDGNADPETAEVLNGLLRNIEYTSGADVAYDTALDCAVTSGLGYLRVDIDYAHDDTFDLDVKILRVANPFAIYGDPLSQSADSSDWSVAFVVDQMSKDAFRAKYKNAEEVDWAESGYSVLKSPWFEEDTIQVCEWWQREEVVRKIVRLSDGSIVDEKQFNEAKDYLDAIGVTVTESRETKSWKVTQRIITGAEILETNEWPGIYIPIIPVYGDEINVEGKRYFKSLVRDAKDAQRMFNYWRTTSTELVALAPRIPFVGPKGAFNTDAGKWATANTTSHPFIEYDGPIQPQRQPLDTGGAAGAMSESLAAADDLKSIIGIFDASLGQRSNETSGIAIRARQRESDTSTFHYIDNMTRAIRHLGRVIVDLIPHVYSGPRILRVIGEDGSASNVPVNQPIPAGQGAPGAPRQEVSETQQAVSRIYDLSVGRYDVVVEAGPGYTTRREEAAAQMVELLRAFPQAAPIIGDLLAKNLDWPGAEEISERFKAMLPPQVQGQNPQLMQMQQAMQQQMQQMQAMGAKIAQQETDKSLESRKLDIDAFNAETNRLKVTAPALGPQEIQALVMQTMQQIMASPDVLPMPQPVQPPPMQSGGFPPAGMIGQ